MANKILTLRLEDKKGVSIYLEKYNFIIDTLLDIIKKNGDITYQKLYKMAIVELKGNSKAASPGMWLPLI